MSNKCVAYDLDVVYTVHCYILFLQKELGHLVSGMINNGDILNLPYV